MISREPWMRSRSRDALELQPSLKLKKVDSRLYRQLRRRPKAHFLAFRKLYTKNTTRTCKLAENSKLSALRKIPPRGRLCSLYRISTLWVKYERSKPGRKITSNFQDCHTHLHLPSKRYLSDILHIEQRSELKTKLKNSSISQSYDRNNFPFCKMTLKFDLNCRTDVLMASGLSMSTSNDLKKTQGFL